MDSIKALALLARASFRPFTQTDWNSYAGCESEAPMIAQVEDFDIIIDGDVVQFLNVEEGEYYQVSLKIEEI